MTLLELIVVTAVVGALAAIANQQFQLHRALPIDASRRSTGLRGAFCVPSLPRQV